MGNIEKIARLNPALETFLNVTHPIFKQSSDCLNLFRFKHSSLFGLNIDKSKDKEEDNSGLQNVFGSSVVPL